MKRTFLKAAVLMLVANPALGQSSFQEGFYAGVDLLLLSPKLSDQGLGDIFFYGQVPPAAIFGGTLDTQLEFSQRVFAGYQGEEGGGYRFRWFTFDNDIDYVGTWENGGPRIELDGIINLDVDYIDNELTQMGAFQAWTWLGSAGVRWARVDISDDINFEDIPAVIFLGDTGVNFEGAGPTLSVEGARPIFFDGFSLFANARTSLLFGETDLASPFYVGAAGPTLNVNNDFVQVWEFQAGARYQTVFMDTCNLFGGIFWEAQRWESDSGFLGDLAFHGFGCQVGVLY